jgi:hypothetical protein
MGAEELTETEKKDLPLMLLFTCGDLYFLNWYSGGWSLLGPLGTAATNGLLCQPRVIMMIEKLVE